MNLGNLTVHSIKQIRGVYTNYLGHYVSEALLDSQSVSFQETSDSEYYFGSRTSITSSVSFGAEFAAIIGGQVGFGELSGSLDMKATLGYKLSSESYYSYRYNFYSVASLKKLDRQSAKYCPTGWSMSIGLIGSWYEITGYYTPFFGSQVTILSLLSLIRRHFMKLLYTRIKTTQKVSI